MSTERLSQDGAIQKTDEQSECFAIECATRLRQQNASMDPTRVFPLEIMSRIFSYIIHDWDQKAQDCQRDFVRLGHICSEWRGIILSIPWFWSTFCVDINRKSDGIPYLRLLSLYVNNSGDYPFRLVVVFSADRVNGEEIFEVLQEYVPKVHTLDISRMPLMSRSPWSSWLSIEHLHLYGHEYRYEYRPLISNISFVELTHLRSLTIIDYKLPRDIQLPGEQITSLILAVMPVDVCMSFLLQCPNLVRFRATGSIEPKGVSIPQLCEPTQNLEDLSWRFISYSACNPLYHQLRFPSLRSFTWECTAVESWKNEEMSALRSLVSNFPPTVFSFSINDAQRWPDDFIEFILVNMRNLKRVSLLDCNPFFVLQFLSLLNRMNDQGGCYILPLLSEVIIDFEQDEYLRRQIQDEMASYVVPLFRLRDPHKTRQFSLQIVQHDGIVEEKLHEASVSLKKDDYAFKIWQMKYPLSFVLYKIAIDGNVMKLEQQWDETSLRRLFPDL